MKGIIAKKIGMSRVFRENGEEIPVTYLLVEPNTVVRTREKGRDGYDAVVLGVGAKRWKTRKGLEHTRYSLEKEFVVDSLEGIEIGTSVTAECIPAESLVTVVGVSKGKGFAGVIKRHNFSGGPWTHGSHHHREPGSVGMCAKPGRVLKGKRLPGRMGKDQITLKHRSVVLSDPKEGVIAIKGPVPGASGSAVILQLESPLSPKA
jgi:large subunit ribosomal protein L3